MLNFDEIIVDESIELSDILNSKQNDLIEAMTIARYGLVTIPILNEFQ